MNKVVYIHRRNDDFSIFYVGMGSLKRVNSRQHRNKHWINIVNKHGFTSEIVADKLSINEAYELESFLISELGRSDLNNGRLVNMTNGGDGCSEWNEDRKTNMIKKNIANMKSVSAYDKNGDLVGSYRSLSYASAKTGVARQTIRDCVNGKLNTAGGYVWIETNKDYVHDTMKWDGGSECMKGGKNPNAKLVLNTETGIFYESMSLALKSQSRYSETAFRAQLNGQNRNVTNYKYV